MIEFECARCGAKHPAVYEPHVIVDPETKERLRQSWYKTLEMLERNCSNEERANREKAEMKAGCEYFNTCFTNTVPQLPATITTSGNNFHCVDCKKSC